MCLVTFYVYAIVWRNNDEESEESAINIYSIFTILEALQVIYLPLTYLISGAKSEENSKGKSHQRWNNGKGIRLRKESHMPDFIQAWSAYPSQG